MYSGDIIEAKLKNKLDALKIIINGEQSPIFNDNVHKGQSILKLIKVIDSCTTYGHTETARNMIDIFYNLYFDEDVRDMLVLKLNTLIKQKDIILPV